MIRIYKKLASQPDSAYTLHRELVEVKPNAETYYFISGLMPNTAYSFRLVNVVGGEAGDPVFLQARTDSYATAKIPLKALFNAVDQAVVTGAVAGVETGGLDAYVSSGSMAIVNSQLVLSAPTSAAWGAQTLNARNGISLKRHGDMLRFRIKKTSAGVTKLIAGAFAGSPFRGDQTIAARMGGVELHANGNLYLDFLSTTNLIGTYSPDTDYSFAVVAGGFDRNGNMHISGEESDFPAGCTVFAKGGAYEEWTMLGRFFSSKKITITALQNRTTGWADFSDGTNKTVISNGALHLLDDSSVLNNQTKAYSQAYVTSCNMVIAMDITLVQLNSSSNMDMLTPSVPGYGETTETQDNNINRSGFSFAFIHPSMPVRGVFSIVKAQDYATTGNIEIWGIEKFPDGAAFRRVYSGQDIVLNQQFTLELECEMVSDAEYEVRIKKGGAYLVGKMRMAMESSYAGLGSLLFQCKGTEAEPAEFFVHSVQVTNIGGQFGVMNFDANAAISEVLQKSKAGAALIPTGAVPSPVAGDSIPHTEQTWLEIAIDTLPANVADYAFRYTNSSNYYRIRVTSAGSVQLHIMNNGSLSASLFNHSSTVKVGSVLAIRVTGTVLELWSDGLLKAKYTSLTMHQAATEARILSLDGAVYRYMAAFPLVSTSISNVLSA